jgi:hypothetical protein
MTPRVVTQPKRAEGPSFRLHRPEPLRTLPTEFECQSANGEALAPC